MTLTDLDQLYINFDLPQEELHRVRLGQTVQLSVNNTDVQVQATVSAIEPQVRRDTRSVTVQAVFDNKTVKLQPGMFASVRLHLAAEAEVLMLPVTAVITSAFGDAVVVVRDVSDEMVGQAEIVPIVVGRRIDDTVTVAQGLQAGDIVVTEGQLRVRPGAELRVVGSAAEEQ